MSPSTFERLWPTLVSVATPFRVESRLPRKLSISSNGKWNDLWFDTKSLGNFCLRMKSSKTTPEVLLVAVCRPRPEHRPWTRSRVTMPLQRTNSCVDIDFTLRRKFKRTAFRYFYFHVQFTTLTSSVDLFNEMSSLQLWQETMSSSRQLQALAKACASSCLQS